MIQRHIVERPVGAWVDEGACVGKPGDLWYEDRSRHTDEAKKICGACPSIAECLQWAVQTGESWGVWGGLTAKERANLVRRVDRQVKKGTGEALPSDRRPAGRPRRDRPTATVELPALPMEAEVSEVAERFRQHRADNTPLLAAARTI